MMGISGKRVDFIDLYGKWMQGVLEKNKRKENQGYFRVRPG